MADLALVTADIGGFDAKPARFPQEGCDEYFWRDVTALNGEHPRMTAKRAKMLNVLPPGDYHYLVWCDASINIRNPFFATELAQCCGDRPMAQWSHRWRDDYLTEAEFAHRDEPEKYGQTRILEQADYYHQQGCPHPSGLWATGVICWNLQHSDTRRFAAQWLAECTNWSYHDQVSEPYVLWRMGLEPARIPLDLYNNPWVTVSGHLRPT